MPMADTTVQGTATSTIPTDHMKLQCIAAYIKYTISYSSHNLYYF